MDNNKIVLRAKHDSIGFLGLSWFEGKTTPELSLDELDDPAIIHFETLDGEEASTLLETKENKPTKNRVNKEI